MDLLSVFKRKTQAAAAPDAADVVKRARTRARQRLIGAAVLVVAGIIGFPLLFESQPRPIPVDLPIEIPRKDGVPPLAMPAAAPGAQTAPASAPTRPAPAASSPTRPTPPAERVITESQADAGREVVQPAPAAASAAAATRSKAASDAQLPTGRADAQSTSGDGARAQALLEGRPSASGASAAGAARFVVQVGAFSDQAAMKEARAKVERLGMKTYTQVADTTAGPRTRVRVGPFATRDDAERAAAKLRANALPTVILAL
jgi:DedD protein